MLALGAPQELKEIHGAQTIIDLKLRISEGTEAVAEKMRSLAGVNNAERTADGMRVFAGSVDGLLPEIIQAALLLACAIFQSSSRVWRRSSFT